MQFIELTFKLCDLSIIQMVFPTLNMKYLISFQIK